MCDEECDECDEECDASERGLAGSGEDPDEAETGSRSKEVSPATFGAGGGGR